MRLRTRIGLMFATGLGVVGLVAAMSWFGASVLLETTREVRTIHERLETLDAVLNDLVDVETGARGYVITGQDSFLEPYHQGRQALPEHLERLTELVAREPEQAARMRALADVEARRLAHAAELVRLRRTEGPAAARALVESGRGGALMREARAKVAEMRATEAARLTQLTGRSDRSTGLALVLIAGSALGMGLLVLIGTLVLSRSITRPLQALARAAKRIGDGEWPAIALDRSDEIGELAEAMAEMARARRAAEAHTRALVDHAPDAFFLADLDGRYIDVNIAAAKLLGYQRNELIGKAIMDVIPPEDVPRLAEVRQALLVPGTVHVAEWSLVRKDHTRVATEVSAKILADGRWQAFARDITERTRMREARERAFELERDHRRRLQAIRESVLAISPLATASPGKTPEVLHSIIEQARRLTAADYAAIGVGTDPDKPFDPWVWSGLGADEVAAIGVRPRPRGILGWVCFHGQALRLDRVADHPEARRLPPGHPPLGPFLGMPIHRQGSAVGNLYLAKPPGASPFTSDDQANVELLAIHATVAIENARLYDEVQAAVAAREELLAVVSHDLKNPLNAILLREELLARKRSGDAELVDHACSIRRSIVNMQRLICGVLDAASLDAGHLTLDIEANDFRAVADEVLDVMGPIAAEARVTLACRVAPELRAHFDRERLAQVVYNLLGNAVKFTPAGGRIELDATASPTELLVTVTDTGRGIAPEVLPHIFERYFTTEHGRQGTGLGLHIARGIVEGHGGRIWATSVPGKGATFHFTIPADPTAARQRITSPAGCLASRTRSG